MATTPARNWQPFFRRVGTYSAASWAALQATYTISDIWDLSDWIVQVLFILLAAGLLFTAWTAWRKMNLAAASAGAGIPGAWHTRQRLMLGMTLPVFLLAMLYLWPDARLNAAVLHLLQSKAHPYDDSRNAAYLLYGVNAPAGQDPVQYGRHLVDTYETTGTVLTNPAPLRSTVSPEDRIFLANDAEAAALFAQIDSIPAVLEANRASIERYRMLRQFPFYTMPVRLAEDSPAPPMQGVADMAYLARREIILEASRGNAARAWDLWEDELAMHRSLFANTDYLLGKFVFLGTVSELVRLRVLLLAHGLDPIDSHPVPRLSPPELSLLLQMRGELISGIEYLLAVGSNPANRITFGNATEDLKFLLLPFRRNATINTSVDEFAILETTLLPSAALYAKVSTLQPPSFPLSEYLVNAAGIMLLRDTEEQPDWYSYMLRIHDLDRLILLSHVAEKMLQEGVQPVYAEGWLSSLDAAYFDPFNGERPTWENGMLDFPLKLPESLRKRGLDLPLPAAESAVTTPEAPAAPP